MTRTVSRAAPASRCLRLTLLAASLALAGSVQANPHGGTVVAGSATVHGNGNELTINQHSQNAIINWQSFSNSPHELIRFVQPSSSAAILNRIVGGDPTSLFGELQSNGQVFLINPNGIVVGPGAIIQTGSFVASTRDVNDAQFMAGGPLDFKGSSTAEVSNMGGVIVATSGDVLLIGHHVQNHGTINAERGVAGMASSPHVLVTPAASRRLMVQVTPDALPGSVTNGTLITAAQVELQALGYNYTGMAVNAGGIISAIRFDETGGRIWIDGTGGGTEVDALLSAQSGQRGGDIAISGNTVKFDPMAHAEASGPQGGGTLEITARSGLDFRGTINLRGQNGEAGNLLLAAANVVIADKAGTHPLLTSTLGSAEIQAALNTANVTIRARTNDSIAGDLRVEQGPDLYTGHAFNSASHLTLQAERDITINDSISIGNGTSSGDLRLQAGRHLSINNGNALNNVNLLAEGNLSLFADVAHDGKGPGTMRFAPGVMFFSNNIRLFAPGPDALTLPPDVRFHSWSSPDPRTHRVHVDWSSIPDDAPSGFYFRKTAGTGPEQTPGSGALPGTHLTPEQITTPTTVSISSAKRGQHVAVIDASGSTRQERVNQINDPFLNRLMAELNEMEEYLARNGEKPPQYTHEKASHLRKEIDNRLPPRDGNEAKRAAYIAQANDADLNAWQANIDLLEATIIKHGADAHTVAALAQLRLAIDRKIAVMRIAADLHDGGLLRSFPDLQTALSYLDMLGRSDAQFPPPPPSFLGTAADSQGMNPAALRSAYLNATISVFEATIDALTQRVETPAAISQPFPSMAPVFDYNFDGPEDRDALVRQVQVLEQAIKDLKYAQARNLF